MGNKADLWKQLAHLAPNAFKSLSEVKHKINIVAVDLPIIMHKYAFAMKTNGKQLHEAIVSFAHQLKYDNLNPIFVEDGKNLKAKAKEIQKRKINNQTQWLKEKDEVKNNEDNLKKEVLNENENEFIIMNENEVEKMFDKKLILTTQSEKKETKKTKKEKKKIELMNLNNYEMFKPNKQDYKETKILLEKNGFIVKTAKYEAEALCSLLCKNTIVDAVITEDSDVLMYGCPMVIRNYKKENEKVVIFEEILNSLHITEHQFTDMCIMMGTDFNENIPNHGFKYCFDFIVKHKNIQEYISMIHKNIKTINSSREIFSTCCYEKN